LQLSPALSGLADLPAAYSRVGLLLPAAWLPGGSRLRRLRDASNPWLSKHTAPNIHHCATVEEAAAVVVQFRSATSASVWTPENVARKKLDGMYPSSPDWTKLMQNYISRVTAPPSLALQGRLTQLVEEDDGIVIGIVVGIA
jgi:hypothetical protein